MGKIADALEKANRAARLSSRKPPAVQESELMLGEEVAGVPLETDMPIKEMVAADISAETTKFSLPHSGLLVTHKTGPEPYHVPKTLVATEKSAPAPAPQYGLAQGDNEKQTLSIDSRRRKSSTESRKIGFHPLNPLSLVRQSGNYDFSEQFKILRTFLIHRSEKGLPPKTIMITSALPGEGKTMISVNLAISIAMGMEEHVLLIDADLRLPSVHKFLGVETELGLVDYLMRDDLELNKVLYSTPVEKLTLLPAGTREPQSATELLASEKMRKLIDEARVRYDDRFVIFDTPPVNATADPSVLANGMDTVLLVVRNGAASRKVLNETIDLLGRDKIRGIIFNFAEGTDRAIPYQSRYKYRYSYPSE